jgi:hypothetical protein
LDSIVLNLPIPKVSLIKNKSGVQILDKDTGGSAGTVNIIKTPIIIANDISQDLLNRYRVFVEMVHYKRLGKSRKKLSSGGHTRANRSGYVVESDLHIVDGDPTWRMPWPANFWVRNQGWHITPHALSNVLIDRPNWHEVTSVNQHIDVVDYFNSRFFYSDIFYRDSTGSTTTQSNVIIPVYGYKSAGKNRVTNRFAYSSWYTPLYVAFRYIVWIPDGNGGLGSIASGPLSRVIKVSHKHFPFKYDYNASSAHGVPCVSIDPRYLGEPNLLQCFFETRLP